MCEIKICSERNGKFVDFVWTYTISIAYDWFCFGYSWRLFDSHWRSAYFLHFIKKNENKLNQQIFVK